MKTCVGLLSVLIAGTAMAQSELVNPSATTVLPPPTQTAPTFATPEKPNEIRSGNVTYSGIGVQAAKTKNPLQMINPLAPQEYGSGRDNVLRDPITGQASGLKIISIQF